jgi:hypothetical protein
MPKKTKLEQMTQIHGKDQEKFAPTTLEQILGVNGQSKFGTMDESEYTNRLNNMPKTDLQAHATQIGIVPIDNRDRLIKTLTTQFRLHVASFKRPTSPVNAQSAKPISPEVAKILALGR